MVDTQDTAPLEATIKDEILRMYEAVAESPEGSFHFVHGREAADLFGYDPAFLDRAPKGAVASFAGVGNPRERGEDRRGRDDPGPRQRRRTRLDHRGLGRRAHGQGHRR